MKNGRVIKGTANDNQDCELVLINKYTRRELSIDEVYVFSVVLCDNDVDRDNEAFSNTALELLGEMFVGKTGVLDHNPTAKNQTARIFSCRVEQVQGKTTAYGEQYYRLVGRAYMPRIDSNQDFIMAIDSGINKEVSVGCSVGEIRCSICGADRRTTGCAHIDGNTYNGKQCYSILDKPLDAYEWSFVAVPSQVNAGVIKGYRLNNKEVNMEDIIKCLKKGTAVTLDKAQADKLNSYIELLEKRAVDGEQYRQDLTNQVVRLSLIVQPEIAKSDILDIADKMTIEQLKSFKSCYRARVGDTLPTVPQLSKSGGKISKTNNTEYNI